MTADPPDDRRLDVLFLRYWDNVLTDGEADELDDRLASDPAARDWFRALCLQATTAADLAAVTRAAEPAVELARPTPTGPTRRRALRLAGAGVAASLATLFGYRLVSADGPVRIVGSRGAVRVVTPDAESYLPVGAALPPGATVSTYGLDSSVQLAFPDGSGMALAGDTTVSLSATGRHVLLRRGNACADVRPAADDPLVLATAVATLTAPTGAVVALQHTPARPQASGEGTEVGVRDGTVMVSAPSGAALAVLGAGEMLTIGDARPCRKQSVPALPDDFAWDLTRPLPSGWHVGRLDDGAVVPGVYDDPYHNGAPMWQIRSDKQWACGLVRVVPESGVRVRYRADRTGAGQVVVCVRPERPAGASGGVIEYNGPFLETPPGQWRELDLLAGDMLDNPNTPPFGPPWVGFLVIFNTYKADLGLRVSDFRVTRPGGPAGKA